jgi:tetratricopeptide (TPR) repeat protein
MKNRKIIRVAAIAVLLGGIVGIYFRSTTRVPAEMSNLIPRSSDASASAEFLNAQKAVEYYRDLIQKKPEVARNYVELAQIYIQEARVTALHHEYFPKAERLLNEALVRDPNDFNAIVTKASMFATLHRFEDAKQLIQRAIQLNPYNAFAYGVLVDAHVELGEYDDAVQACDKMLSIRPDLRSYARASYLRELHGDNHGAKQAMQMAGEAGVPGQENRAWAFFNLGKLHLNEGKLDTAEFIFNGILQERPKYAYAMLGLAQVRSAQGRYDEAITLLKEAWQTTPEHIFLEELASVYTATAQNTLAAETIDKVLKEFSDHVKEGWNVDKEYAMFCANHNLHLDQALTYARREYERRPNNIEALDTYAWTLFKNGRPADAVSHMQRALRLGTRSAAMKYHAAAIYAAAGNRANARELLQEALAINPYITALYSHDARKLLADLNVIASN